MTNEYTHKKGKGAGKYNGMARASDWERKTVVANRQIRNGGGDGAACGTIGTVTSVYAGLDITFEKCTHCGSVTHINKVGYFNVDLA